MFLKDNAQVSGFAWIAYSLDGSGSTESLVQTQPSQATPAQLVLMGITVAEDPPVVPAPPAVPQTISDRQFFQQLAVLGIITQAEALAAVKTGDIPAALDSLVGSLPVEQQFSARMLLCGATIFERNHPMTLVLAQGMGWSAAQLDALWIAGAAL